VAAEAAAPAVDGLLVAAWFSWSATARATATLVSIRSCGGSSLVDIAQHPNTIVTQRSVTGRDNEQPVLVDQPVVS
jgi:hypothetical protein